MKKFLNEFKEFAMKGNVIDMAVGVVIGSAFSAIVTSLVNDMIMPIIALFTSNVSFSDLKLVLKDDVTLNYGNFIQVVVNFIIIAFSIFVVIKAINATKAKFEELAKQKEQIEEAKPAEPSDEVKALNKIISLLENKQ